MASPIAGVSFINAVIFGTQANVMRFLDPGLRSEVIAGGITGLVQSVICCPVELAKLRIQVDDQGKMTAGQQSGRHGSIQCLTDIYKKRGLAGCYRGMAITMMRETPSFAIYFGTFEYLCQRLTPPSGHRDSIGPMALLFAGGVSGSASWFFTYPIDVIKSRYQADSTGMYRSLWDCTKKTYQAGGLAAFSRGLSATLLRAFPSNAATFATVVMTHRFFVGARRSELDRMWWVKTGGANIRT